MSFAIFMIGFGIGGAIGAAATYRIWRTEIRRGYEALMDELKAPSPQPKMKVNRLTVILKDGRTPWVQYSVPDGSDLSTPHRAFFKWLHGRRSEFFNWGFRDGFFAIRRDQISYTDTRIIEIDEKDF